MTPSPPAVTEADSQKTSTATPLSQQEIVAQVNQQLIPKKLLQIAQAVDRAVTAFLSQPSSSADDVLEIVINGELVWQQAVQEGFVLNEEDVASALDSFVASQPGSRQDLEIALNHEGIALDVFEAYYARLLAVDAFSSQKAQSLGITQDEYLESLQKSAQISFGPAAMDMLAPQATATVVETPSVPSLTPLPQGDNRGTREGQYAPLFELPAANVPAVGSTTFNDFLGKPLLLSFWTTWCPYCQAQTPVLVAAYEQYGGRIEFVGINVGEDPATIEGYLNQHQIGYPILLDREGQTAAAYKVSGYPTTYFINAEGQVVVRQIGQLTEDLLDIYLRQLLDITSP